MLSSSTMSTCLGVVVMVVVVVVDVVAVDVEVAGMDVSSSVVVGLCALVVFVG